MTGAALAWAAIVLSGVAVVGGILAVVAGFGRLPGRSPSRSACSRTPSCSPSCSVRSSSSAPHPRRPPERTGVADKPETLEETQARLARVQQGAALPPPVSSPIPSVSGAPASPYGPAHRARTRRDHRHDAVRHRGAATRSVRGRLVRAVGVTARTCGLPGTDRDRRDRGRRGGAGGHRRVVAYNAFSYDPPTFAHGRRARVLGGVAGVSRGLVRRPERDARAALVRGGRRRNRRAAHRVP